MGVTIHFEGRVGDEEAFRNLVGAAASFASKHEWLTERIKSEHVKLLRVRGEEGEEEWDYEGPAKGIVLYPHGDCDPIRLEFDRDWYVQEFTKTQFAGVETHIRVVELLRTIQPFFREFKVQDEGEFWQTADAELLAEHIENTNRVIEAELLKNPSAQVKVRLPDGRIVDMLT